MIEPIAALGRMAREALAKRCQMRSIIDSTGEAIIGTDLETKIRTWNAAAEHTFGYTAQEVAGAPLSLLFPVGYDELARALDRLDGGTQVDQGETVATRKDGSSVDVALTLSLVRNGLGAVTGFSVLARDVTDEVRMRSELADTLRGLETALGQARQSEAAERGLLADVAHQLRSPLAGIRASSETLLRGVSPAVRDRLLAAMVKETCRADRLLAALLQMARLEEGHNVRLEPCDLETLCEEEAARLGAMSPDLVVEVRIPAPLPAKPELDAAAVREIISNLLDNARRHTATRIDVALSGSDELVEVRVSDDGPGLPEGMAEKAFERFVSLDGKGGSGLGLPIARSLARAHGGDLTYHDRAFVLSLPMSPPIDS
jgi:PAS domain S-box-containing protein